MGPTRVWYLLGAGASEEEPIIGLPWVAVVVNKVAAVARAVGETTEAVGAIGATAPATVGVARGVVEITTVAGGAAARGGEELRTLGRKACPPRVFTMVGLKEERRWRGEFQTGNGDLK